MTADNDDATYDYVIVGAGSAGCVLAARLSQDPSVRVCLIEAGPVDSAENIHVPSAFSRLFRTEVDWDYATAEEPALHGRSVYLPRGRVLGGTSSVNAMVYARNNRRDFDEWGLAGWSYDELLPYFRRSEDNERGASYYHGAGGPLGVADGRSGNVLAAAFVEAALAAGHPANDDFNGARQDGFGFFQVTQRDGRRHSTAAAYLRPAADRPNLTVRTDVRVHRVLLDGARAVGVTGRRLDEEVVVRAEREVILCAGAYNSPQLLMLSGIGPADQLGMFGIDVALDHPEVGANLHDHPLIPLNVTGTEPVSLLAAGTPQDVRRFAEEGRGPLTSNGPEAGGFVRTRPELPAPDVEFFAAPVMFVDSGLGLPTAHALSCGPALLTPRSRGRVSLASADPTAKPRIEHRYFAEPEDLDTAVAALRLAFDIAGRKPLAAWVRDVHRAPASHSDADLKAYVRRYAHSIFHAAGSCAIGAVVDEELRVRGAQGLRVVDASVLPAAGRGQPNALVVALAEKAADLVRGVAPLPAAQPEAAAA
jgi:choline dehydrogenase-like flavoprotein